jgi:UDP-glucose 4-epimerase
VVNTKGFNIFNLGTGEGYSVHEVVDAFERVNEIKIPCSVRSRREGDVAVCFSSADKANKILGWTTLLTLDDICKDAWRQYTQYKV